MVVSNPSPPKAKLTGGQKWLIAGLLVLQVPSSLIFYPLAAVFSLTGIGIPLSMIFLGIGTMPFSLAMKRKRGMAIWRGSGLEDRRRPTAAEDRVRSAAGRDHRSPPDLAIQFVNPFRSLVEGPKTQDVM